MAESDEADAWGGGGEGKILQGDGDCEKIPQLTWNVERTGETQVGDGGDGKGGRGVKIFAFVHDYVDGAYVWECKKNQEALGAYATIDVAGIAELGERLERSWENRSCLISKLVLH